MSSANPFAVLGEKTKKPKKAKKDKKSSRRRSSTDNVNLSAMLGADSSANWADCDDP